MISIIILFIAIIVIFTVEVSLQYAAAAISDENDMHCKDQSSYSSKCSKKDTPFILPFP